MNYASIATLIVFYGYTIISVAYLGPLDSLSQSYYIWKNRKQSRNFNVFGAGVFFSCLAQTLYQHEENTSMFFVLAAVFMWGLTVGSEYIKWPLAHYLPTFLAIGFGYAAVQAEFGFSTVFWLSFGSGAVGAALLHFVPYRITWQELWVMTCIIFPFIRE